MKKHLILVIIGAIALLSACKQSVASQNSSISTSDSHLNTDSIGSNSAILQDNSEITTSTYLKTDPEKTTDYNIAIEAYNDFLCGKTVAISQKGDTFYVNDLTDVAGKPGIGGYALFDVSGDGIPELHTTTLFYDIYSYQNGQVVHSYTAPSNNMHVPTYPLENGALFTESLSTGWTYTYTTFDYNCTASEVYFCDPGEDYEGAVYLFNNKKVSKEDWTRLTKEYFALSEKPADIKWYGHGN